MDNFYLVLAYLVIGFLLRRQPAMPQNSGIVLNIYVLYVALPALILKNIKLLEFSFSLLIPAITPWLLLLVVVALVLLLSKFFNWSREVTGALLIILPLGNTSFLGFPMTEALFGNVAMPYAPNAERALIPNAETVRAMKEARRGKLRRFDRVEDVMADLHAKD